ncbi:hypothetical protein DFP73DRAFT_62727 [Morchella snyderi]|nr:hypothetical protein DFP73DRAFT_62727 [Morchella snyderi]
MHTLRRYCRVSKYTVLECRIYLHNPSDLTPWLTNVLPRIFASVKPLVLPKLHEEQERARLGGKKAAIALQDVIVEDDYELSLFLTNSGTRHAVMTKQKSLPTAPAKLRSNSSKLTGGGGGERTLVEIRRESSPPEIDLDSIPMASTAGPIIVPDDDGHDEEEESSTRVPEPARRRSTRTKSKRPPAFDDDTLPPPPPPKRHKTPTITVPDDDDDDDNLPYLEEEEEEEGDDKKKLVLQTSYEGFNIYSHILCIVVKRRRGGANTNASAGKGKIIEEWIGMSQAIRDGDE